MALRSKADWLILRGAFAELKNMAGNTSQTFRGYLLNSNFEAAGVKEIGRWIGLTEKQSKQILADLEDVGLLEQVDTPDFEKKKKSLGGGGGKKSGRSRGSPGKSGRKRRSPGKTGNKQNPLKKKVKVKVKVNGKTKVKKNIKKELLLEGPDETSHSIKNMKTTAGASTTSAKGSRSSPTTTPPLIPLESDAGESRVIPFKTPPESRRFSKTERLGEILRKNSHRYDTEAQAFAEEVYSALRVPNEQDSANGRREMGNFAKAWMKAKNAGLEQGLLSELWSRTIEEAKKIGRKRKRYRKPSAVWRDIFNGQLSSRCSKKAIG